MSEPEMVVESVSVEAVRISGLQALDPIHVYWIDLQPGQGYVTICCYGAAWTCYFGGMGGRTIRQFFADANTDYLVTKLGITVHLYQRKRDREYLRRIIDAVKESLTVSHTRTGPAEPPDGGAASK